MNSDLKQIIEAAQQGDEAAFTELYEQTCDYAYYLADRFLSNQNDIKDVLQESYISAFRNIQSFDTNKDFKPWIKTIVRNKCINLAKKRTDVPVDLDEMDEVIDDDTFLPAEYLEREDKRKDILSIIDHLPPAQRTAVVLFYFEELSVAEIAELTEVSESTVKTNLFHARKKIKALVLEEEKKGNKLYGVLALPALRQIFEAEAAAARIPTAMSEAVLSNTVASLSGEAAAAGATASAASSTPTLAAKFAAFSTPVKAAIIGGAALLLIGAAALVLNFAGGSSGAVVEDPVELIETDDNTSSTVSQPDEESASEPEAEEESSEPEESTDSADVDHSDDESEEASDASTSSAEVVAQPEAAAAETPPTVQQTGYNRYVYDASCPDIVLYDGIEAGLGGFVPYLRTDYSFGGSYADETLRLPDYYNLVPKQYFTQSMSSGHSFDSIDRILGFFRQEYQGAAFSGYREEVGVYPTTGKELYSITCMKGNLYVYIDVHAGTVNLGYTDRPSESIEGYYIDVEISEIPRGTIYRLEDIEKGLHIPYSEEEIYNNYVNG